jgi:hypothetical protein
MSARPRASRAVDYAARLTDVGLVFGGIQYETDVDAAGSVSCLAIEAL